MLHLQNKQMEVPMPCRVKVEADGKMTLDGKPWGWQYFEIMTDLGDMGFDDDAGRLYFKYVDNESMLEIQGFSLDYAYIKDVPTGADLARSIEFQDREDFGTRLLIAWDLEGNEIYRDSALMKQYKVNEVELMLQVLKPA